MSTATLCASPARTNLSPHKNQEPYRVLLPFVLRRPLPHPLHTPALRGDPDDEPGRYFTNAQDEALIRIMASQSGRMTQAKWTEVARLLDPTFNARRVQERWNNFLRPSLDQSPFTLQERRAVARLMLQHPKRWHWIATQLSPDQSRSPAMVKHVGTTLQRKVTRAGFQVDRVGDIDLLPDELFRWGFPKGAELQRLRQVYCEKKAEADASENRENSEQTVFRLSLR
jgi:hypothetical protein